VRDLPERLHSLKYCRVVIHYLRSSLFFFNGLKGTSAVKFIPHSPHISQGRFNLFQVYGAVQSIDNHVMCNDCLLITLLLLLHSIELLLEIWHLPILKAFQTALNTNYPHPSGSRSMMSNAACPVLPKECAGMELLLKPGRRLPPSLSW